MYYLPQIKPKSTTFFEIFSSGRSLEGHLTVKKEKIVIIINLIHCTVFFIFIPRRSRGTLKMIL